MLDMPIDWDSADCAATEMSTRWPVFDDTVTPPPTPVIVIVPDVYVVLDAAIPPTNGVACLSPQLPEPSAAQHRGEVRGGKGATSARTKQAARMPPHLASARIFLSDTHACRGFRSPARQ